MLRICTVLALQVVKSFRMVIIDLDGKIGLFHALKNLDLRLLHCHEQNLDRPIDRDQSQFDPIVAEVLFRNSADSRPSTIVADTY